MIGAEELSLLLQIEGLDLAEEWRSRREVVRPVLLLKSAPLAKSEHLCIGVVPGKLLGDMTSKCRQDRCHPKGPLTLEDLLLQLHLLVKPGVR